VKGTAFDQGQGNLDPNAIADRFWDIYTTRRDPTVEFPGR
jgi:hypothetical protein